MKKLKVTDINDTTEMPIKRGTLQFLQDSYKETFADVISTILEAPVTGTIYILSGCRNTLTAPNYNITPGVLFYNGEIYRFDGAAFVLTGLEKAYANIETTQYLTFADPVQFTDGVSRNVHNIEKITITDTAVGFGLPEFKDFVRMSTWLKGDTKEVVCDAAYVTANFDGTGMGRLERSGWAIMNGQNGTVNDDGRVVIAYGATNTGLGNTGGSKDAVVVSHTHSNTHRHQIVAAAANDGGTDNFVTGSGVGAGGAKYSANETITTDSTGVSGTDKNMQPYIIRLRIQKIQ